jgi:hypothetical protein
MNYAIPRDSNSLKHDFFARERASRPQKRSRAGTLYGRQRND